MSTEMNRHKTAILPHGYFLSEVMNYCQISHFRIVRPARPPGLSKRPGQADGMSGSDFMHVQFFIISQSCRIRVRLRCPGAGSEH
jgi:hypothetical protein